MSNVLQQITTELAAQKQELAQQAQLRVAEIEKQATQTLATYKQQTEDQQKTLKERLHRRQQANQTIEKQRLLEQARHQAITAAFDGAQTKLGKQTPATRKKYLATCLKLANKEISVAKVWVNSKDLKLLPGVKTQKTAISGGIIAEVADGSISIDYSLDTTLNNLRKKLLIDVHQALFGESHATN